MYLWSCQQSNRPHTTRKNARNMKSVSQTKLPFFEGIFKLWTHKQQQLPFLQMFISIACQNIAVLCVKRISFFLEIFMLYVYEVYSRDQPWHTFTIHFLVLINLRHRHLWHLIIRPNQSCNTYSSPIMEGYFGTFPTLGRLSVFASMTEVKFESLPCTV